jgi:transcriptional regulator with XRE-family HTH domain
MNANAFGKLLKNLRMEKGLTLREFCQNNRIDPGNYSRLERGLFPPPQREEILEKYALALGLKRGSDEWLELFDLAAAARGQLPKDLLSDEEVVEKLPAIFRTLRGSPLTADKLDELIEKVRRS